MNGQCNSIAKCFFVQKYGLVLLVLFWGTLSAQSNGALRQRLSLDEGWRFALGHANDIAKDFNHNANTFTYFAKAGYGDGAAAQDFDDRAWRVVNVPHDWCVELPFDSRGTNSHGSKAIGSNFPENSIGWYRRKIFIPAADKGKRLSLEFDGVHRNSKVWVNGFYLGTELSGTLSFAYDITDYVKYGEVNVIAVRADAMVEEGWYYEGAGIYRHVWLTKTQPVHVDRYGTFVTSELNGNQALITSRCTVWNESLSKVSCEIEEQLVDQSGKIISKMTATTSIDPYKKGTTSVRHNVQNPVLWSLESPAMHTMRTLVKLGGNVVDQYDTPFGIRTVKFDANKGFFLNGKSVKVKGVNNHQDHAGVGVAIPDALQEYRVKKIKEMGANAIRTSHNPPTPELLDICDRLGMLILDEHRLMGVNAEHLANIDRLILRDRNHPCVFLWSLGNEEWYIEGDERGARLAVTMQNYAKRLDSSRAFTIACSGGWDTGIGTVTEVMGYNYLKHGNVDEHHKKFPWQASIGTEESNTIGTRGIYFTDETNSHLAPSNIYDEGAEGGWKYYDEREFLAGLFYWTGFDYRGEPTPYGWPAVVSQFGILDACGFPKDIMYYMKSWWVKDPVLHIATHWNWKEGQEIPVKVYSNCEEVELFLNKKSLGKKKMPRNGHLEWNVIFKRGVLSAKGTKNGITMEGKVETTGAAEQITLSADRALISADGKDVSVVTVSVTDEKGKVVPDACPELEFSLKGNARIIGVGNGNPSSHEADQFHPTIQRVYIQGMKELTVSQLENRPEIAAVFDDSRWIGAFSVRHKDWKLYTDTLLVVRGAFELPTFNDQTKITFFGKSILESQSVYINGKLIRASVPRGDTAQAYVLDHTILKPGTNTVAYTGKRFRRQNPWEWPNTDPGLIQIVNPANTWKRKVFNGYMQVLIQSDKTSGKVVLKASSSGLKSGECIIELK